MKKKVVLIALGYLLVLFLISRVFFGSKGDEEQKVQIIVTNSYLLLMQEVEGIEFDTSKHYKVISSPSNEVILKCFESGGIFGSSFEGTIKFNPQNLRGNWVTNRGKGQGGRIHLNHEDYGFSFVMFYDWGDLSHNVTKVYGNLVRH